MIRSIIGRSLMGIGLLWMWFGPAVTKTPDCNPLGLFGCGILNIGVDGVFAAFIAAASKFLVGAIWIAVGVLVAGRSNADE